MKFHDLLMLDFRFSSLNGLKTLPQLFPSYTLIHLMLQPMYAILHKQMILLSAFSFWIQKYTEVSHEYPDLPTLIIPLHHAPMSKYPRFKA